MNNRRALCLAFALAPVAAQAQEIGVRITGSSWLQSIDLRPLQRDSVAAASTTLDGGVRRGPNGVLVSCRDGATYCYWLAGGNRESARPLLHDLSVAAWGLGRGISFHASMRVRQDVGGSFDAWPRLADRFDALEAYFEVDRERGRARVGRQWALNALGSYAYDGASLLWLRGNLTAEAYAGRALVQGLNESYTSPELGAVDDLPPDNGAMLLGARMRMRRASGASGTAVYQRILRNDRSGLYAERASVDGSWHLRGYSMAASLVHDVASNVLNEGRLRVGRTSPRRLDTAVEIRRHRPFFELWTIWGAFAPVGYDEARAMVSWRSITGTLGLSASGGYREYADAGTGLASAPLRSDGWRAGGEANWAPSTRMSLSGSYGVDIGFGASQSDGTLGARWQASEALSVGMSGSATQTVYEFRVGTGRIMGLAADVAYVMREDLRVRADAGLYRHRLVDDALGPNWSQRRASVRVEWAVGRDPGME